MFDLWLTFMIGNVQTGRFRLALFLTLIGGGVFGNRLEWILSAIQRSLLLHQNSGLDVFIVSYGASKPEVLRFVDSQT
jgi:hypothetical protein